MSSKISNPLTFGKEIEIIRQRFFVEYITEFTLKHSEEYTMICKTVNEKGIDNIFISSPALLPNLKIYDSDGTELALITNKLTKALINNLLRNSTGNTKDDLEKVLKDMDERKIYLLWIKLPSSKRFFKNESRVITLKYDSSEAEQSSDNHVFEFHSAPHEVFYIIKPPPDYEIAKETIEIYDSDGVVIKKQEKGWENKKGDPFYFNKTKDYTTARIRPGTTDQILFTHSLKPHANIVVFPMFILALLSIASTILFASTQPFFNMCNIASNCSVVKTIASSHIELGIGIIIASLALPHLIQNQSIRDSLTYAFVFPIILAIFGILFIRPN